MVGGDDDDDDDDEDDDDDHDDRCPVWWWAGRTAPRWCGWPGRRRGSAWWRGTTPASAVRGETMDYLHHHTTLMIFLCRRHQQPVHQPGQAGQGGEGGGGGQDGAADQPQPDTQV